VTPEERDRLARVETRVDGIDAWMESIAKDVKALRTVADTGNGALKTVLIVGGVLAAVMTAAWAVFDKVFPSIPHH
jgi:hypothetical protein